MVQYEENKAPEMGLFCFGVIFYLANFNKSFTTGEETCIQLPRAEQLLTVSQKALDTFGLRVVDFRRRSFNLPQ